METKRITERSIIQNGVTIYFHARFHANKTVAGNAVKEAESIIKSIT